MFQTTPLSQRDPGWRAVPLGFGDSQTIGSDGCTLTCLTMVANGLGFSETPATLNDKLKGLGANVGFIGPLMVWAGLTRACPGITLNAFARCRDTAAPMDSIDAALDAGRPVVVELDMSPSAGLQNHWVVLLGRQDGDYLIFDPWPVPAEPAIPLTSRYGFSGAPSQIITAAVFYDRPGAIPTPPPPQPQPASASSAFTAVVLDTEEIRNAGGLALREFPPTGAIKLRLPPGTELAVREPDAQARPKVGVFGQWLSVATADGVLGFVAAWLVSAKPGAASFGVAISGDRDAIPEQQDLDSAVQPPLRHTPEFIVTIRKPKPAPARKRAAGAKGRRTSGRKQKRKPAARTVPMRSAPAGRTTVARLAPGARLTALEPEESALPRLGRRGQWLHVRDAKGNEGYVSALAVVARKQKSGLDTSAIDFERALSRRSRVAFAAPGAVEPMVRVLDHPDIRLVGGLALRDAPITGAIKMRLPMGTPLLIREELAGALPKVGVLNQWLRVATTEGVGGFVAAWYVEAVPDTLPAEPPVSPSPAGQIRPDVIAQGTLLAANDTPLYSATSTGSMFSWRVAAGTPLRVIEPGDWASKLSQPGAFVRVQSYAFKEGFVPASSLKAPSEPDTRIPVTDANLPKGQSAWLYGLHDPYDRALFANAGKTGWVLFTERVVSSAGNTAYEEWANAGYGVIGRLNNDYGGSGTVPTPDQYDTFAEQCAQWVKNSRGCFIWVIGNEMNNPREWPEEGRNPSKAITPESYAHCYNRVRAAIKAVQPNAVVLPGALDCFQGPQMSCLEWFSRMLGAIDDLDGFALHCYTNGYTPDLITSLQTFGDDPLRWQYFHFRAYTTFLDVIPARWRSKPVYITETDPHGTDPWQGGQNGWVQTAYAEIHRYNQQPHAQQIQSLILYRWSRDDHYTILGRPGVQNDIRDTANNTDYRWRN